MEEAETPTSNRSKLYTLLFFWECYVLSIWIDSFKLAAYGVKQGGIGSILAGAAGGMGLRKKAPKGADEETTSSVSSLLMSNNNSLGCI